MPAMLGLLTAWPAVPASPPAARHAAAALASPSGAALIQLINYICIHAYARPCLQALELRWRDLLAQGRAVVAVGDFNICPAPVSLGLPSSHVFQLLYQGFSAVPLCDFVWT